MTEADIEHMQTEDAAGHITSVAHSLGGIRDALNDFTRVTEVEFLEVGTGLQDYHRRSAVITNQASTIVDLMHGKDITGTMQALQNLLDRISRYAENLENELSSTDGGLREILAKLDNVSETVTGFRKIVKTMTILGLSTKIENARNISDEESFNVLADDLVKLAGSIDSQAGQVQGQLREFDALVRDALHKVQHLKSQHRHQARRVLSATLEHISRLEEKNQLSSRSAEEIALLARSISEKIGDVVASIQSHDLTRQQIEHVVEALLDLEKKLLEDFNGKEGYSEVDLIVGEVCHLQRAQLDHSREQLLFAVGQIRESLNEIAVSILAMSDQTRRVAGATNEAGVSFLAEMEQGTAMIASVLNDNADANRESVATLTLLAQNVAEMKDFLQEIERIGGEMKVLALNAGIKAARISEGGGGLSVIAEAIQKLSGNALLHTTSVTELLRDITDTAQTLSKEESSDLELQGRKVEEFLQEIGSLLHSLRGFNEEVVSNLTSVGDEGRSLAEEIDLTASGLSVKEKTIRIFDPALAGLKGLGASWPILRDGGHQLQATDGVYRDMMGRYTMKSEREIHRLFTGATHKNSTDDSERSGGEFGDNVELF